MDDEGTMRAQAKAAEYRNLLSQLDGIDALHDGGGMTDEGYAEARGMRMALAAALGSLADGKADYLDEGAFQSLVKDMRAKAAEPTQLEVNTANIDYLMMLGGEA